MRRRPGGIIHTYQGYDPVRFPSPTQPPADVASAAFEHMLRFGETRSLTPEELADAVEIDPEQIAGLGPSLDSLIAMLEERKRKILQTYETGHALALSSGDYAGAVQAADPPEQFAKFFRRASRSEQLREMEALYMHVPDRDPFSDRVMRALAALERKYAIEKLDAKRPFTGRQKMDVDEAIAIGEELDAIDELLEQLREARKNAKVAIIDLEALSRFADEADVQRLQDLADQVREMVEQLAQQQGVDQSADGYRLSPKAYKLFQGKLLEVIFGELEAARSGRHRGPVVGDGPVETPRTRAFEFGDSAAHLDAPGSVLNAFARADFDRGTGKPRLRTTDLEVHETRNNPKCATVVIMDMSGSMRYGGQYVHAKRMALALDGLIRSEYPGDVLRFIEMYTFAKLRTIAELPEIMPKPVTIRSPVVRLSADMSDPDITEWQVPPHFTNIQHALSLARRILAAQDTPNRQIVLLTDGLPTAHFEGSTLYLLYPAASRTEHATMREAEACRRENIVINTFLLPNWSQTEEDVRFAHRMAENTGGRVLFTGGSDVDRFVLWDYVSRRRSIIG
ncbi:MAG: hypothetical protein AAFX79_12595 [Planctomycetota bacterium]